ncbi:MAG: hypothetical protein ITD33_07030 [Nitrosarchaeum sp.]|nr:hypothetical protein [Nitrosarchaeum sp.]
MNYKNAITMTTLSAIALLAIASSVGIDMTSIDAQPIAVQSEKFTFAEKVAPTAEFHFGAVTEITPIQKFIQTGGYGIRTASNQQIPTFTLEKVVSNTPYLYKVIDESRQKLRSNSLGDIPLFDVTLHLSDGASYLRGFEYQGCKVTTYVVSTLADNEEGYSGKAVFAVVDQMTLECMSINSINPAHDVLNVVENAKTISSSDLKSTDKWESGFSSKP